MASATTPSTTTSPPSSPSVTRSTPNRFIEATDREILQDAGKVTTEIAKAHAESEFEKYRIVQDRLFESDFDRLVKQIESSCDGKLKEQ